MTKRPDGTYIEDLTWDREANAAYLAIRSDRPGPRSAALTVPVEAHDGQMLACLDFDSDGALLGVELLDAATQLTAAMKEASTDITRQTKKTELLE